MSSLTLNANTSRHNSRISLNTTNNHMNYYNSRNTNNSNKPSSSSSPIRTSKPSLSSNSSFSILNNSAKAKPPKGNRSLSNRNSSVVYIRDEFDDSELDNDAASDFTYSRIKSKDNFADMDDFIIKPPVVNAHDLYNNNGSSNSSRRTSVPNQFICTPPPPPPPPAFAQHHNRSMSAFSSPLSTDEQRNDYFSKKNHNNQYRRSSSNFKSNAPIVPQYVNAETGNIYVNSQQHHIINSPMGPMIPLQVAVPNSFDYNYGSYLIPANLLTPYTAHQGGGHSSNPNSAGPYNQMPQWKNFNATNGHYSSTNSRGSPIRNENEQAECKVTYQYSFSKTNSHLPVEMQNSIIFTNVNDSLKLYVFMKALNLLYSENVKNAIQFKIDKNGEKEVNTFLLEFINYELLDEFTNEFIRDLHKWKKQFKSANLIFKKCSLQTNIMDPSNFAGDFSFSQQMADFGRFLIVDTDDVSSVINLLKPNTALEIDGINDKELKPYLKLFSVVEVNAPEFVQQEEKNNKNKEEEEEINDNNKKKCHLLIFHNQYYKKIALDLFKSNICSFDVYDYKHVNFAETETSKKNLVENEIKQLLKDEDTEGPQVLITRLKNDGSFNTCPFSDVPFDIQNDLQHDFEFEFTGKFYKVIASDFFDSFKQDTDEENVTEEEEDDDDEKHSHVDILTKSQAPKINIGVEDVAPSSSTDTFKSPGSPINIVSATTPTSVSSDTLNGEIIFDSRNKYSFSNSPFSNSPSDKSKGGLEIRKTHYTNTSGGYNSKNRLIFISNLPPVVKTFDIVNIVRGGILEQIQYVSGKRYCFIKFIYPESALKFYENSQRKPVILHGYPLSIQFGNKGNKLPPVSPSLLRKVSAGATRNIYLSLPEFAYKQKYITDSRYDEYKQFRLPKPQQIIDDFSLTFGPLEQINFAGDGHCCWINFMNIDSAIKIIERLQANPEEFHHAFQGRYEGLVLRYGKDRCEKEFKNFP